MTQIPKDRVQRIELAAAILFGRDAEGRPEKGWRAKLARLLDRHVANISRTLDEPTARGYTIDRLLFPKLRERAQQMVADADTLNELADVIEAETPKLKD